MEAAYGGRKISASQEPGLLRGMRKLLGLKKLFYNFLQSRTAGSKCFVFAFIPEAIFLLDIEF